MSMYEQFEGLHRQLVGYWDVNPASAMSHYRMFYENSSSVVILRVLNAIGGGTMARGKGNGQSGSTPGQQQWTQFVTISLAGVTANDIDGCYDDDGVLADAVAGLVASGYRVGISFDAERDSFIASVTCRAAGDPNEGRTFTSFAHTWPEALKVAMYKHYIVCAGVWPEPNRPAPSATFG